MLFDVMIVEHPELHQLQVRYPSIPLNKNTREIWYNNASE
jgi:hypothetical protein